MEDHDNRAYIGLYYKSKPTSSRSYVLILTSSLIKCNFQPVAVGRGSETQLQKVKTNHLSFSALRVNIPTDKYLEII